MVASTFYHDNFRQLDAFILSGRVNVSLSHDIATLVSRALPIPHIYTQMYTLAVRK
jgi:hypothetical protein